ncbi:MAG: type II secretion system protein GspK [Deltaproteobacteria bacterium]|nr:type II secretion system protein GspK [Deltaproteobacteria bacterium]
MNITRNFKEQTEAHYIALAGVNRAISELIRNQVLKKKTNLFGNEGQEEEKDKALVTDEVYDDTERWRVNAEIPAVRFGAGLYQVRIGNEAGKINLNEANETSLKMIMDVFELDDQQQDIVVDSILDWRDGNDLHRLNGAEDDYYNALPEPYNCKDGDFDSLEELLLVRGVTPELFYGGLKDMVTVGTTQSAKMLRPSGILKGRNLKGRSNFAANSKICVNAATKRMLRALPLMTDDRVQSIIDFRKDKDFETLNELSSIVGPNVYQAMEPYITLEENAFYTISSMGMIPGSGIRKGIEAMIEIRPTLKKGWRVVQWRDGFRRGFEVPSDAE